jgi:hypothetical protein
MVFCCFVARSKASTVAVISVHVRMRRPAPYRDPQTHRHGAKAAHFSPNAGSFGAYSTASADRLHIHIHCTSLLHAKLVAPDKVTAIVTAWLELWGWWVLSSYGWLACRALLLVARTNDELCHALVPLRRAKSAELVPQQTSRRALGMEDIEEVWTHKLSCGSCDLPPLSAMTLILSLSSNAMWVCLPA